MISTPIFGFGAPVYYDTAATQVYQNDNGAMVRNFFAKDAANCIPNVLTFYRSMPNIFGFGFCGGGGGCSEPSEQVPETSYMQESTYAQDIKSETDSYLNEAPAERSVPKVRKAAVSSHVRRVSNPIKSKASTQVPEKSISGLGTKIVNVARKYSDCTEEDGSHHKFCINPTCKYEDPRDQEWCTDFVTYVVKEAYRNEGKHAPAGFGDHDVETLKNWAIKNDMFIRTSDKSRKGRYIAENIKPGDIFIMNENGSSHTGIVTHVDKNTGEISTIEGNRDDRVKEYSYSPDNSDLSGFIRLKP